MNTQSELGFTGTSSHALERLQKLARPDYNGDRSETLLTDFPDSFTDGWHMAVRDCFATALDIKPTPKIKDGISRLARTQGGNFAFAVADVIYDSPDAYKEWSQALKKFRLAYEVTYALPVRPRVQVDYVQKVTDFTQPLTGRKAEVYAELPLEWTKVKDVQDAMKDATGQGVSSDLLLKLRDEGAARWRSDITPRSPGVIHYKVLTPNENGDRLITTGHHQTTQDSFVRLLITGQS